MAALEVVEQGLERHPGSDEYRLAAQDLWISMYCTILSGHRAASLNRSDSKGNTTSFRCLTVWAQGSCWRQRASRLSEQVPALRFVPTIAPLRRRRCKSL